MDISIEGKTFEKIGQNLYRQGKTYYRLFAHSISDNRCWLINPVMQELRDIETATGKDVYGPHKITFDSCGTVPMHYKFIRTTFVPEIKRRDGWRTLPGIPAELF